MLNSCESEDNTFIGQTICTPIKPSLVITVWLDHSLSMEENQVIIPGIEAFNPIVDYVVKNGGTITFSSIDDASTKEPPIRLNIKKPPECPVEPQSANKIQLQKERIKYRVSLESRQLIEEERLANVKEKVSTFKDKIETIITRKPDTKTTDFYGSLMRATQIFNENNTYWRTPKKYFLGVTDAIETSKRPEFKLPSDVQLVIVHGVSNSHIKSLNPEKEFESVESAILYIANPDN